MVDKQRRKQLIADAQQRRPPAGVYRVVNRRTGRALLASSVNLDGIRNRIGFALSTGAVNGLDHRLRDDLGAHGFDAFEFEVVDVLDVADDASDAQVAADVAALESLWRERLAGTDLY